MKSNEGDTYPKPKNGVVKARVDVLGTQVEELSMSETCRYESCDSKHKNVKARNIHEGHVHGSVWHGDWDNESHLQEQYVQKGKSIKEIADENDATYNTVRNAIIDKGIKTRNSNDTRYHDKQSKIEKHKEEIISKYQDENRALYLLGEDYGVNDTTIKSYLEDWGVETRSISEQHIANSDYPEIWDEQWLRTQYRENERYTPELAEEIGCTASAVANALEVFDIETFDHGDTIRAEKSYLWKGGKETRECEQCGLTFECRPASDQRLCSINCRGAWVSENLSGENWPTFKGGGKRYYGENWAKQRTKRIKMDSYQCVVCSITREKHYEKHGVDLNVHHVTPLREFDDPEQANTVDNLRTLCKVCHAKWEGIPVAPQ